MTIFGLLDLMTPVDPKVDPGIIFGPFTLMNPRWTRRSYLDPCSSGPHPGDHIWTLAPVDPKTDPDQ